MSEPITDVQVDPLELSAEEFAALPVPSETVAEEAGTQVEKTPDESESSAEDALQSETSLEADSEAETGEAGGEDSSAIGSDTSDSLSESTGEKEPGSDPTKSKASEKAKEDDKGEPGTSDVPVVDYKAEYEKLLAPFKANGMDMQAHSVDDAIQLMQMGAGFHKKMAALKPAMRQMKLLEKHGLLDDEKLNYLIDLNSKKPEAIQKLLKDSKIDPLDIDVTKDSEYKPTLRKVSDTEIMLDEVLAEIRDTPTYSRTLTTVSKEWDESSQNTIANEPQIIKTINGHMQDGTFDAVMRRVEYERSLGRFSGVPDLQAYMLTGNAMADEGKLQRLGGNPVRQALPIAQPPKAKPSKEELERKERKRAASPVKTSKTPAVGTLPDPLEMSTEEFAKLDINKYIKS